MYCEMDPVKKDLLRLQQQPDNQRCFDCVPVDTWATEQVEVMKQSGNQRGFREMKAGGEPSLSGIKEKYTSESAHKYRLKLSAIAAGYSYVSSKKDLPLFFTGESSVELSGAFDLVNNSTNIKHEASKDNMSSSRSLSKTKSLSIDFASGKESPSGTLLLNIQKKLNLFGLGKTGQNSSPPTQSVPLSPSAYTTEKNLRDPLKETDFLGGITSGVSWLKSSVMGAGQKGLQLASSLVQVDQPQGHWDSKIEGYPEKVNSETNFGRKPSEKKANLQGPSDASLQDTRGSNIQFSEDWGAGWGSDDVSDDLEESYEVHSPEKTVYSAQAAKDHTRNIQDHSITTPKIGISRATPLVASSENKRVSMMSLQDINQEEQTNLSVVQRPSPKTQIPGLFMSRKVSSPLASVDTHEKSQTKSLNSLNLKGSHSDQSDVSSCSNSSHVPNSIENPENSVLESTSIKSYQVNSASQSRESSQTKDFQSNPNLEKLGFDFNKNKTASSKNFFHSTLLAQDNCLESSETDEILRSSNSQTQQKTESNTRNTTSDFFGAIDELRSNSPNHEIHPDPKTHSTTNGPFVAIDESDNDSTNQDTHPDPKTNSTGSFGVIEEPHSDSAKQDTDLEPKTHSTGSFGVIEEPHSDSAKQDTHPDPKTNSTGSFGVIEEPHSDSAKQDTHPEPKTHSTGSFGVIEEPHSDSAKQDTHPEPKTHSTGSFGVIEEPHSDSGKQETHLDPKTHNHTSSSFGAIYESHNDSTENYINPNSESKTLSTGGGLFRVIEEPPIESSNPVLSQSNLIGDLSKDNSAMEEYNVSSFLFNPVPDASKTLHADSNQTNLSSAHSEDGTFIANISPLKGFNKKNLESNPVTMDAAYLKSCTKDTEEFNKSSSETFDESLTVPQKPLWSQEDINAQIFLHEKGLQIETPNPSRLNDEINTALPLQSRPSTTSNSPSRSLSSSQVSDLSRINPPNTTIEKSSAESMQNSSHNEPSPSPAGSAKQTNIGNSNTPELSNSDPFDEQIEGWDF